jgi:hypothetical protein
MKPCEFDRLVSIEGDFPSIIEQKKLPPSWVFDGLSNTMFVPAV